jgi:hypothetical protein
VRTFTLYFAVLLVAACSSQPASPADPCGDGVVQPGETSATCCLDAGCDRGVCDPDGKACVDPWVLECKGKEPGDCSPLRPYVCEGDLPPTYDCGTCGCPDGQTCDGGICLVREVLSLRRNERTIPRDLPIDDYFRFITETGSAEALPYAEALEEIARRMREDARRSALNLGESHSSPDEQAVALALVRAVARGGYRIETIGVEGGDTPILDAEPLAELGISPLPIKGNLTNDAYCKAVTSQVGDALNTDLVYVQFTGSGHTSQEACFHREHYAICQPPHAAECLARTGRKSLTVMLFDPDPWLTMTDNTLLWRAGERLPDEARFDAELDASLAAWTAWIASQTKDARFDASAEGRDVNVRFVPSPRVDDVFIAYFPRPEREPFLLRSFRAVWSTPNLRAYLLEHAMRPQNCSISWDRSPGAETYWVYCSKDDKKLTATVDRMFRITESAIDVE